MPGSAHDVDAIDPIFLSNANWAAERSINRDVAAETLALAPVVLKKAAHGEILAVPRWV